VTTPLTEGRHGSITTSTTVMKTYKKVLCGVVTAFALSALVYQTGLNERGGIGGLLCRYVVCEDEALVGAAHRRLWSGELDGAVELGQSSLPGRGRQQNTALDGPGTGAVARLRRRRVQLLPADGDPRGGGPEARANRGETGGASVLPAGAGLAGE